MPFGIYVVAFIYIILSINTTMEMIMLGKKYLLLIPVLLLVSCDFITMVSGADGLRVECDDVVSGYNSVIEKSILSSSSGEILFSIHNSGPQPVLVTSIVIIPGMNDGNEGELCIETARLPEFIAPAEKIGCKLVYKTGSAGTLQSKIVVSTGSEYRQRVVFPISLKIIDGWDLLMIVEEGLGEEIADDIEKYTQILNSSGFEVVHSTFSGASVSILREVIKRYYTTHRIGGVWLIGDLPVAWYEKRCYGKYDEEFPFDIYLMDLDDVWRDSDGDGMFDGHDEIEADLFTARMTGSADQISTYLDKAAVYHRHGELGVQGAFIFKDDDWQNYARNSLFSIDYMYSDVILYQDTDTTTRERYLEVMTGRGVEYAYQWIHSWPAGLSIEQPGGSGHVSTTDIRRGDFKCSFFSLFDCSAARFTGDNLAMTYVMETDFGLSAVGSTKIGGIYQIEPFHEALIEGKSWGESYRRWYNTRGVTSDDWFLGMVIVGDPLLEIETPGKRVISSSRSADYELLDVDTVYNVIKGSTKGSYAEYMAKKCIEY
jgi:hypothetical protein